MFKIKILLILHICFWGGLIQSTEAIGLSKDKQKHTNIVQSQKNGLDSIEILNKQGVIARNRSKIKDALSLHFQALALAEKEKDTLGIIKSLNSIGTDLRRSSF